MQSQPYYMIIGHTDSLQWLPDLIKLKNNKIGPYPIEPIKCSDKKFDPVSLINGFYVMMISYLQNIKNIDALCILEITIPTEENDLLVVQDPINMECLYTNKILVNKIYSLFNPETYIILDLDITKYKKIVERAAYYGKIEFLEWWKDNKHPKFKILNVMNIASENGMVEVLEWWHKNSDSKPIYTSYAMNMASQNGYTSILEWWKNSGLKLKYNKKAIYYASISNQIDVLDWWLDSGLKLKYNSKLFEKIDPLRHRAVWLWWFNSDLKIKCPKKRLDEIKMMIKWTWMN